MGHPSAIAPIRAAGITLGMGMGGFFDGIVFHQILQLHAMLSARVPNTTLAGAKFNMVWDGVFHALVWMLTAVGIGLLWRAARRPAALLAGRALLGAMLMGWGAFNLVEGTVNHHILHLHHVYEVAGESLWDLVFLGTGALMLVLGWRMVAREAAAAGAVG